MASYSHIHIINCFIRMTLIFNLIDILLAIKVESINLLGHYELSNPQDITIIDNIAYIAELTRLNIINVVDHTNPTFISEFLTKTDTVCIKVINRIAYVTDWDLGLRIINVSDPYNPFLLGNYTTPNLTDGLYVDNNDIAYLTDYDTGWLYILNVSNPSDITLMSSFLTPGLASDVNVVDDVAYIADGISGLWIIDVSNLSNPFYLSSYDTPGISLDVIILNGIAFIADGSDGLRIVDVSNPLNPFSIGNYSSVGSSFCVSVRDNLVFLADSYFGLFIFEVTDLSIPVLIGNYSTSGSLSVAVVNNIVFLTYTNGLLILEVVYSDLSNSFTLLIFIITSSFFSFLLLIFAFYRKELFVSSDYRFDKHYLIFSIIGILNFISDVILIIYLSISETLFFTISLSIFAFSVILNYICYTRNKYFLVESERNIHRYILDNRFLFNIISFLSMIINPNFLFVLVSNLTPILRFPFSKSFSIPFLCILYDIYSVFPQSVILYYFAFRTPFDWNFLWIVILFKLFNQIIAITRLSIILYYGGGKSEIHKKDRNDVKDGIFRTIKVSPVPGLKSITDSVIDFDRPSIWEWATRSRNLSTIKPEIILKPSIFGETP